MQIFVEVVRPIGPYARPDLDTDEVAEYFFRGLAVAFKHGEKEEGQHQADHQENRRAVADCAFCQQISRQTNNGGEPEADKLSGGHIECKFRGNFR